MAEQPTLFELSGYGIHASYSTTSVSGDPLFSYQDAHVNKSFRGSKEIKVEDTAIGSLVTVVIMITVDGPSTSFSLLLPRVKLPPDHRTNITAEGITTLHRSTIAGPVTGQIDSYTVHAMQGTAAFVVA
jgi:hypothetical protein